MRKRTGLALLVLLAACGSPPPDHFPGYVEGEYVRLAAPAAGALASLLVRRGDQVAADAPLFALEHENEQAVRLEAAARVTRAQSMLDNVAKGRRVEEIAAVRAQLAQAEAQLKLSSAERQRAEQLVAAQFIAPSRLDEVRTAETRNRDRVTEMRAQLAIANLAARPDEIAAARADLRAAEQQLAQAAWRLAQKSQRAPQAALVADTLYNVGEWVPAGMPVVSLLPRENLKVRFYVAEKRLATIRVGATVRVNCDGCTPLEARISWVSPQAEYTAPMIYSKESRANLVFMVEARFATADTSQSLPHPGQPVEVSLAAESAAKKAGG